jgi:hypothetical protein
MALLLLIFLGSAFAIEAILVDKILIEKKEGA